MGRFDYLRMLVLLSFRNLFSHAIKSVIVGFILGGGTLLLVFFTAMLDSVEVAMSTSIIGSLAGHAQVDLPSLPAAARARRGGRVRGRGAVLRRLQHA